MKSNVWIIGEVGSNWFIDGRKSFEVAEQLIKVAKEAGCDAVKFQYIKPDIYVDRAGSPDYLNSDINALFKTLEVKAGDLHELSQLCKKYNIEFMCSVFEPEDVPFIDKYVSRHKIASYEACHRDLVNAVIRTGKPMIMSFGGYLPKEILEILSWLPTRAGTTIMHCVASYPVSSLNSRLEALGRLKGVLSKLPFTLGYSDHTVSTLAPSVAVAMGARVVEKHFTLSRRLPGPDHRFALEPRELKQMVSLVREADTLVNSEDVMSPGEELLRNFAVRSVQAIRNIRKGDILSANVNISCKRPGNRKRGETGLYLYNLDGKKAACDIPCGDGVLFSDVEAD